MNPGAANPGQVTDCYLHRLAPRSPPLALWQRACEVVAQSEGWAHPERDVQEYVAGGRQASAPSSLVDHLPQLLVARARQAQILGQRADTAVRLGDGDSALVQALGRRDEAHVDSWGGANHGESVADNMQRVCDGSAPRYASNRLLLDPGRPRTPGGGR